MRKLGAKCNNLPEITEESNETSAEKIHHTVHTLTGVVGQSCCQIWHQVVRVNLTCIKYRVFCASNLHYVAPYLVAVL